MSVSFLDTGAPSTKPGKPGVTPARARRKWRIQDLLQICGSTRKYVYSFWVKCNRPWSCMHLCLFPTWLTEPKPCHFIASAMVVARSQPALGSFEEEGNVEFGRPRQGSRDGDDQTWQAPLSKPPLPHRISTASPDEGNQCSLHFSIF